MGKRSRDKGANGEREVARIIADQLGIDARRSAGQCRRGDDAPDLVLPGLPFSFHAEVKRSKMPNIRAALAQAAEAAKDGAVPVAMTRRDADVWLVTMTLDDWINLVRESL